METYFKKHPCTLATMTMGELRAATVDVPDDAIVLRDDGEGDAVGVEGYISRAQMERITYRKYTRKPHLYTAPPSESAGLFPKGTAQKWRDEFARRLVGHEVLSCEEREVLVL